MGVPNCRGITLYAEVRSVDVNEASGADTGKGGGIEDMVGGAVDT